MGVSLQSFKAELFHKLMMKKSSTQLQSSNNNVGLSSIEEQLPLEQTSASSNDSLTPAFSIEEKIITIVLWIPPSRAIFPRLINHLEKSPIELYVSYSISYYFRC